LLAATLDGSTLHAVGGTVAKFHAAWTSAGIDRVVTATDVVPGSGSTDYVSGGRPMLVVPCADVKAAYDEATGLASGLRRYLTHVRDLVNENLPPYLGTRRLSDLYMEPEVLSNQVRPEREPDSAQARPSPPVKMGVDTEEQELLEHYRDRSQHRREAWQRVWPKLACKRAVLVGYPGEGKTVLALMTVRALAERGLNELAEGKLGAAHVTLPIFVRLGTLGNHGTLAAAVLEGLAKLNLPARLLDHLAASLQGEHCWLVLDGLDEVAEAGREAVRAELERLAGGRAAVVVTSRPRW
jgi:hypothetical protein